MGTQGGRRILSLRNLGIGFEQMPPLPVQGREHVAKTASGRGSLTGYEALAGAEPSRKRSRVHLQGEFASLQGRNRALTRCCAGPRVKESPGKVGEAVVSGVDGV